MVTRADPQMSVDGILNMNKPRGMTSHDVVGFVRRLSGQKRVGHAGTLDPMAEGVLVVVLGKATKIVEYIVDSRKVYCAEIVLGISTTTYDVEGEIVSRAPFVRTTRQEIERALSSMTGEIEQLPPMYSAVKRGGERLYELARRGVEVEREARTVIIYRAELLEWRCPVLKLELEVSKGTYIRSFAQDLGQKLGTGAYLNHLVRVASGHFTIDDALTPGELERAFEVGYWPELVYTPDEGMLSYNAVLLSDAIVDRVRNGQSWPTQRRYRKDSQYGPTRAYSPKGEMVAVVELDDEGRRWLPKKVLV
ncbi:MAG: tRNA pseudouridine(55) synthase TruB [Chloroflexota bacterium]